MVCAMNGRPGQALAATYGALVVTHLIAQLTGHDLLADGAEQDGEQHHGQQEIGRRPRRHDQGSLL